MNIPRIQSLYSSILGYDGRGETREYGLPTRREHRPFRAIFALRPILSSEGARA